MIRVQTNEEKIPADQLRDGDWVVGDFGDQLVLLRYQDSLVQGDFRPVILSRELLELLGFTLITEQPEGSETDIYQLNNFRISVINNSEFIFEGGARGRITVNYLHLLQQQWRQIVETELITDFFEQPHTIELMEE